MENIVYRITLDLKKSGCQHVVAGVKVGDTNRVLEIRLTEGGVPYQIADGVVAQICATLQNGAKFTDLCEVEGNVIRYKVSPDLIGAEGEIDADIQLGDQEGNTFSAGEILFLVYKTNLDSELVPEEQYNSLIQAIAVATGKAVKTAEVNEEGNLVIVLADDTSIEAGHVVGPVGPVGPEGPRGETGPAGPQGAPQDPNNLSNALKKTVSGNAVRIDDSSTLEHDMKVTTDVGGATVKKYGKSLLSQDALYRANVFYKQDDGRWFYGKVNGSYVSTEAKLTIPANTNFTCSFEGVDVSNAPTTSNGDFVQLQVFFTDGTSKYPGFHKSAIEANGKVSITYYPEKQVSGVRFSYPNVTKDGNYITFDSFRIELGTIATEHEDYKDPETITAEEDGTVNGIIGNGDTVTLLADNGVIITAEYNQDINKAIEEIRMAIGTMGAAAATIPMIE